MMTQQSVYLKLAFKVVLFCIISQQTQADPRVSSVEAQLEEGGTVRITGSGFSNSNAVPHVFDTVDNQESYDSLSSGEALPENLGIWTQNTNQWGTPIEIVKSGDLRTRYGGAVYFGQTKSFIGWPSTMNGLNNKEIYVSWWYKPNQLADSGGSNKFIRIWDEYDGTGVRISWTQMHMTYGSGDSPSWATTQPTPNEWNRFEIYANTNTGEIVSWLNGSIVHDVSDHEADGSGEGLTVGLIGFDASYPGDYPNLEFRLKDIYVSETLARIEISDTNSWDPKSNREVLKVNSWSDSEVNATFNQFSLDPGQELYVYVFDASGIPNKEGFPLLCEKCPETPQSVEVN